MRANAGWNQLAIAIPNESMTPEHVRIPDNLVRAIEKTWQETVESPEQEKGGNIVKNGGSGYDVRRYGGDANGDTFRPNDSDVGWRQSLIGMIHTHSYGEYKQEVPEGSASFFAQDFDAFMRSDAHLSVLTSGPSRSCFRRQSSSKSSFQRPMTTRPSCGRSALASLRRMTKCSSVRRARFPNVWKLEFSPYAGSFTWSTTRARATT